MSSRRRRQGRRARRGDHPEPARPPTPRRAETMRRAAFDARMARIRRTRSIVGLFGFVPLVASILVPVIPSTPLALVPREVYLGVWAAVFGTFLGLTVRMWRERRAFEREGSLPA